MNPDVGPTVREAVDMPIAEVLPYIEKKFAAIMSDPRQPGGSMSESIAVAFLIIAYRAIIDLQKRVNELESEKK